MFCYTSKFDIFRNVMDPLFICFLVSVFSRSFFRFAMWENLKLPFIAKLLSTFAGIASLVGTLIIFLYSIAQFRSNLLYVKDQSEIHCKIKSFAEHLKDKIKFT